MDKMKTVDLKNGWKIKMHEKNEVFFNENKVATFDYDNNLEAIVWFEDDKVDFLQVRYGLNPKIRFTEKKVDLSYVPEDDE